MSNRNSDRGKKTELWFLHDLENKTGLNLISTRKGSRQKDANNIDIMSADEETQGKLPVDIQVKDTAKALNIPKEMAKFQNPDKGIILERRTKKSKTGKRFVEEGKYVHMTYNLFRTIVNTLLQRDKDFN